MIGRLIRLIIVVLVVLAVGRIGSAYFAHYRFDDEVSQIAQRSVQADEAEVRSAVMDAARRYTIPIEPGQVSVRLQGEHVFIDIRYIRPVELFPRYTYPWQFSVSAHGWVLGSGGKR
jgi:hypothetical protein